MFHARVTERLGAKAGRSLACFIICPQTLGLKVTLSQPRPLGAILDELCPLDTISSTKEIEVSLFYSSEL